MKVEQQNVKTFKPIIITLETREEADFLWHLLNGDIHSDDYEYKKEVDELSWQVRGDMFDALNFVHEGLGK